MRIHVVYHSEAGHTEALAHAVAEGARSVEEAEVRISSVYEAQVAEVAEADGLLWGSGGHFGGMSAPLKGFIEKLGMIWLQGKMVGKVGAVFCTVSTLHGGAEETLRSLITPMFHLGMLVTGLPLTAPHNLIQGSYYGLAVTCPVELDPNAPPNMPTREDLEMGRELGSHVARVTGTYRAGLAADMGNR